MERFIKTFEAFAANDRNIGHDFWIFHGFNYLTGNPFPTIYHGARIYRGVLFSYIMEHHLDKQGRLDLVGRKSLMWVSTQPKELFRAAVCIRAFVRKYQRDPHSPNDPYVGVAVNALAELMTGTLTDWGHTEELHPKEYYRYRYRYHLAVQKTRTTLLEYDIRTRKGWEFWANVHREAIAKYGLPPGVPMPRLEYRERNDRGYLKYNGRIEEKKRREREG